MTAPEVIDRAALASLLETVGDDPEFLGELIDSYFEDTTVLLASMRQAVLAADSEALRRAAHSLKSNSATFGATRLAGLCQRLEALARDGDLTEAGSQLAEVEDEYGRVRPALEAARQGT